MSTLTAASPAVRHSLLAAEFARIADAVEDWDAPTPVPEWKARDIVAHLAWLPQMLDGMDVSLEVEPAADPAAALRNQSAAVQDLLDSPEASRMLTTQEFGELTVAEVVDRFYSFDLYAHAWDLARSARQPIALDEDYATEAYTGMSAMGEALHASGHFGRPQPVPQGASAVEKLLALIGRNPRWAP